MTEISQLERARRAIKRSELNPGSGEEFSVAEFSKESVERLIEAMNAVREEQAQTDKSA